MCGDVLGMSYLMSAQLTVVMDLDTLRRRLQCR